MKQISFKRASLVAASAAIAGFALFPVGAASAAKSGSVLATFSGPSTTGWRVPNGIKKVTIDARGAAGGAGFFASSGASAPAGLGGEVTATFSVQPGQVLQIVVGGQGGAGSDSAPGAGGFNGGANGGLILGLSSGGGGGGASDVRTGACAMTNSCDLHARILVAGGGGGAAGYPDPSLGSGGFGGGYFGGSGGDGNYAGGGGTQTAGGAGGGSAAQGTFGQGGDAGPDAGGGGGGGWYGGGGGDDYNGGGGGSGYILPAIFGSFQIGVQSGDGFVVIYKAS
jgi:glycine rich protein